jgi:hypothetical protein
MEERDEARRKVEARLELRVDADGGRQKMDAQAEGDGELRSSLILA